MTSNPGCTKVVTSTTSFRLHRLTGTSSVVWYVHSTVYSQDGELHKDILHSEASVEFSGHIKISDIITQPSGWAFSFEATDGVFGESGGQRWPADKNDITPSDIAEGCFNIPCGQGWISIKALPIPTIATPPHGQVAMAMVKARPVHPGSGP